MLASVNQIARKSADVPSGNASHAGGLLQLAEASRTQARTSVGRSIGGRISYEGKTTYQGKTYYFCSSECKQDFNANPAKYVKQPASAKA